MGCDIHSFLEVRRFRDEERKDGVWINADKWSKNQFAIIYSDSGERMWEIDSDDRLWYKRWYFLFAVLAGVRNNWNITPISEPKGFPEDADEETRKEYEHYGPDGHTHSWLTLKELNEWDGWDSEITDDTLRTSTYRKLLGEFHERTIKRMMTRVNRNVTENDVRMVFWFDN